MIELTKKEMYRFQRTEKSVYKKTLERPSYTQVAALRREVGAAHLKTRIMESQLK